MVHGGFQKCYEDLENILIKVSKILKLLKVRNLQTSQSSNLVPGNDQILVFVCLEMFPIDVDYD